MWQVTGCLFLISLGIFIGIMRHDPRTLWSGAACFWMLLCLAVCLLFVLGQYAEWLQAHEAVIGILVFLVLLAVVCLMGLPAVLVLLFFVEGIRMIRHEGRKAVNFLSLLFSLLLCVYLAVWPLAGGLTENSFGTVFYEMVSFLAIYAWSLLAVYTLSAVLNLIHLSKKRHADYIVVLGAGIRGTRVTPLLAARIEKGISLLAENPDARLILSGGQGPGEEIPESEAMAAYAAERGVDAERIIMEQRSGSTEENLRYSRELMEGQRPKVVIVTTAYHVFRALLLARQQGILCVGFGSRTKMYFALNAFLREFAGYLRLSWKLHLAVGIAAGILAVLIL